MKIFHATWAAAVLLTAQMAWAQNAGPTDPQIAAIVVTANQVDIDAGKLAKATSKNKEVKDFAERMIVDHGGVLKAAGDLVTKLKVTPESNATSAALQKGGDDNLAALKKLSGSAFDRAYVDHEVVYHQAVLEAVDKTLIPSASNAELKALLVKVRPAFVAHLEHAKMIQASLAKSAANVATPGHHTVTIEGMTFQQVSLSVRRGDSITWVNKDLFPHTVTSITGAFDSREIAPSQSWSYVAKRAGNYSYRCTLHPTMTGRLTVA
jgi:putative membrane protein